MSQLLRSSQEGRSVLYLRRAAAAKATPHKKAEEKGDWWKNEPMGRRSKTGMVERGEGREREYYVSLHGSFCGQESRFCNRHCAPPMGFRSALGRIMVGRWQARLARLMAETGPGGLIY